MADEMALEKKIDLLVEKVDGLTSRIGRLETKFDGLEGKVDRLETRVKVGFEESHRLLKLSLEGLGGLEETTTERFDEMKDDHAKQIGLLQNFGVHLRHRVDRVDPRHKR